MRAECPRHGRRGTGAGDARARLPRGRRAPLEEEAVRAEREEEVAAGALAGDGARLAAVAGRDVGLGLAHDAQMRVGVEA